MGRVTGAPSFITEPKSWDVDALEYGSLELSAETVTAIIADAATATGQAALLTELQCKADLSETQPISMASAPVTPVTGTFWQATQPISGTVTTAKPSTSTFTSPSALVTSSTVLAANANRLGATIYNESGAICFLKLGATASLTSYTVQVPILGLYEVPFGYTGVINGITVAITAVLRVTEFTA